MSIDFTKKVEELKKKYAFNYLENFGPFSTPIDFDIFDEKIFLLNFGTPNNISGNLEIYNPENKKLLEIYKLSGNPKAVEKFEKDMLIIVKHLKQGIFLFDLKTGKEELFIDGKGFLNPSSVLLDKERIYITDVFDHKIRIFSKQGILVDEIDLRGKAEFPVSIIKKNEGYLLLTLGTRIFYPQKSSGWINPSPVFYLQGIKPLNINLLNSPYPFTDLIVKKDYIFLLNRYYLYKIKKEREIIFRKDLRGETLIKRNTNHLFYKMKLENNLLFILERMSEKKMYVYKLD